MPFMRELSRRCAGASDKRAVVESLEHRVLFHGEPPPVGIDPPVVTVAKQAGHASEAGTIKSFTLTRGGATDAPLTVHFVLGGRAKNGIDYGRIGNSVTIPAGASSIRLKVRPV